VNRFALLRYPTLPINQGTWSLEIYPQNSSETSFHLYFSGIPRDRFDRYTNVDYSEPLSASAVYCLSFNNSLSTKPDYGSFSLEPTSFAPTQGTSQAFHGTIHVTCATEPGETYEPSLTDVHVVVR
jgi:hypothetical protein